MPIDSCDALLADIGRAGLLETQELDHVRRTLLPRHHDPLQLALSMVGEGYLSPYQAEQMLDGRGQALLLGGHRIIELLGQGGMGQVFKAEQSRLHRIVAIKVIQQGGAGHDPDSVRRFHREALAAARLSHPHVVAIYEAGQDRDTHFIVMEYVEGMDLAHVMERRGALPVEAACRFVGQAALGLQHAHERGMVHRDIKPSNLLVTSSSAAVPAPEGATKPHDRVEHLLETGLVKIADMGLARVTRTAPGKTDSLLTEAGEVVGTPDYIAPEQARCSREADARSDIYSLGCTFYHLLAGHAPFLGGAFLEKLLMHQLDEPEALERIRPEVSPALAAVVRKMMAKDPNDRYQEARHVFDDLAAWTSGAGAPVREAPAPRPFAREPAPETLPNRARTSVVTPGVPPPSAPRVPKPDSWAEWPSPPTHPAHKPRSLTRFQGHKSRVLALAFAPDRNTVASAGEDATVRVWDFSHGHPIQRAALPTRGEQVRTLAFSGDQKLLAAGTNEGWVWLWNMAPAIPTLDAILRSHHSPITALAASADGRSLASGSTDHQIQLWDLQDDEGPSLRATLEGGHAGTTAMTFASDGKRLAAGAEDGTVTLWSPRRFGKFEQSDIHMGPSPTSAVAFSPDGSLLAGSGADGGIHLFDVGEEPAAKRPEVGASQGVARILLFSTDGQTLEAVEDGGRKVVWALSLDTIQEEWIVPTADATCFALTFDGRYLALGGAEGGVVLYRVAPKRDRRYKSPRAGDPLSD